MLDPDCTQKWAEVLLGALKNFQVLLIHLIFEKAVLSVDRKTRGTWSYPPAQTCWHWHLCFKIFFFSSYVITATFICDFLSSENLNWILNLSSLSKSLYMWRQPPLSLEGFTHFSFKYTHHVRNQIKPEGSKEAVLMVDQMHANHNWFIDFWICHILFPYSLCFWIAWTCWSKTAFNSTLSPWPLLIPVRLLSN